MSAKAADVEAVFVSCVSPLTERKIQELVGKKDISEALEGLLENGTLKKHEFAPDLALYWPASWYQKENVNCTIQNTTTPTTNTPNNTPTSKPTNKPKNDEIEFKTPSKPSEKGNHLATASASLKARLKKKRPSPITKTPPTKPSSNSASSSPTSSSPLSSPPSSSSPKTSSPSASSPESTPTTTTSETPNAKKRDIDDGDEEEAHKQIDKKSWLTTPSPKRRKVIPPSKSPANKGTDIESLEKEKKRLQDAIAQKEALIARKNKSTKPVENTPKATPEAKARDDKQLDLLTKKWRSGCEQMLMDLQQTTRKSDGTGGLTLGQMIDSFQFERSLFPNLAEDGESFE